MGLMITEKWLHAHCSNEARTAWTRAQLDVLGVPWPPAAGWKRALIGRHISAMAAETFEMAATQFQPGTLKQRRKAARQKAAPKLVKRGNRAPCWSASIKRGADGNG